MCSLLCLVIVVSFSQSAHSQVKASNDSTGSITGYIVNSESKTPVEFANVILFKTDSTQVSGTAASKDGEFAFNGLKLMSYYIRVQIIGYVPRIVEGIVISQKHLHVDLRDIYLKPFAITLPNVVTRGTRPPISYQLGKEIIAVDQIKTALAGTAADILENVPSVSVDINGNVSLRGSTNFQVLINGRRTVMDPQDALQQIPASSIKTIEIMANPSAKYDASGTAGIINIVLKKNPNLGLSGMVNLMGGLNDKYGGNLILQYKTPFVNYNFGLDHNRLSYPGINRENKQFTTGSNTSFVNSDGSMLWQRITSGVTGGLEFYFDRSDNLTLGGTYGTRTFYRLGTLNFNQWTNTGLQKLYYLDNADHNHFGNYYEINSNYVHKFGGKGHDLVANLSYRYANNNNATITTATQNTTQFGGTKTTETGPFHELRGNIDYTLPINKSENFSAGSEYFGRIYQHINGLYLFDTTTSALEFQSPYSHTNNFNRTRFAAYSMFSDRLDSLQVQVGFRTEYTYQMVAQADTNQRFTFSRWDYFPSFSTSYSFGGGTQIMASYSRRIERPDGDWLQPYYSWVNATTVNIGNPLLKPELIDSYQAGMQTFFGKAFFSNDVFYRFTLDKIQQINSVYETNVALTTAANVGNDYSLGYEFSLLFNPISIWQLNLMGSLYNYKITGAYYSQSFARQSIDWSAKANNTFTLSPSTEIQLNARYYSASVTAQGKWGGYFTADLAAKEDIIPKTLSLTLQVNDLFGTGRREFTSQGIDLYDYNYYYRRAPMLILTLRYNFNNYEAPNGSTNDQTNN